MSDCEQGVNVRQESAHVCVARLERADKIMRHSLGIFDILETMHPSDFLEFRDYIGPASGFQSVQMREMEILIGLEDHERVRCGFRPYTEPLQKDTEGLKKIALRKIEPSVKHVVYKWLDQAYQLVPDDFLDVFLEKKVLLSFIDLL
jgi:tryptophan 2,3-dioxygenase